MELSVWLQIINVVLCECWSVLELRIIKCKSTESCLWTSFMSDMWMTCFPARPLLWLVISPTRRSPKKHKLNALANIVDKLNGHTDNTKSFLVTKILEGSKRKNSPKADLRLPVSMNLLKRLIQSPPFVCTSVYESTMFASAFSLCFFGLLRVGEITSQSKGRAGKHESMWYYVSVDLFWNYVSLNASQRSLVCGQVLCRICEWRASRLDLYFD
jgi:hypothetical protein